MLLADPSNSRQATWLRAVAVVMFGIALLLFALHAVHLAADFPNNSPWVDWSKYTDEGWYGDAAIRYFLLGHWYVPGDFNPAAALPVWPLLEALLFRLTGVSLVAARGLTVTVFGGILLCSWKLLRRWSFPTETSLAAPTAVLLLAASPFCFVFTRMAILEPLLILLVLLALLAAGSVRILEPEALTRLSPWKAFRASWQTILALGLLLPALVLTKTTGLFLLPAIAWMLYARCDYRFGAFLRIGGPAGAMAILLWLLYFGLAVRPHFLLDYRYLFSANGYTGISLDNAGQVLSDTLKDGLWMGRILFPAALIAGLAALLRPAALRRHPLLPTLLLWAAGYTAFLAYHNNLQPRYYLVIAVPLSLLLPAVGEQVLLPALQRFRWGRSLGSALAMLLVLAMVLPDARQTIGYVRHPDYTLVDAAHGVARYIAHDQLRDPRHNPLLLSISGSDISLMTGLPSICDDFGTLHLADRAAKYHPGWYAAWNQIDDDKMDDLTPLFQVERVAAFPAMDDPDRNLLILYRLNDAPSATRHPHPRKPVPRPLRTRVGQQPSVVQLEH